MLSIVSVDPLDGRTVRMTLSDGSLVVRDLTELLAVGGVLTPIRDDDVLFRQVSVRGGTLWWPGDLDLAPETLIWDGPFPAGEDDRRPEAFLRPRAPLYDNA